MQIQYWLNAKDDKDAQAQAVKVTANARGNLMSVKPFGKTPHPPTKTHEAVIQVADIDPVKRQADRDVRMKAAQDRATAKDARAKFITSKTSVKGE